MTQIMVLDIMKKAFYTVMMMSGPILAIALVLGFLISILQAATQVQEQTLSFVPKLIGIAFGLIIFGNFMMNRLISFTVYLYNLIPTLG